MRCIGSIVTHEAAHTPSVGVQGFAGCVSTWQMPGQGACESRCRTCETCGPCDSCLACGFCETFKANHCYSCCLTGSPAGVQHLTAWREANKRSAGLVDAERKVV